MLNDTVNRIANDLVWILIAGGLETRSSRIVLVRPVEATRESDRPRLM